MKYTLNINLFLITIISLFFTSKSHSMLFLARSPKHMLRSPRINRDSSYHLLSYAKKFLIKHHGKMVYEKNESGFIRVNLPIMDNSIEKLRLNYWPASSINTIQEESIHNHPRYFESIIINGGYQHQLYTKHADVQYPTYGHYKILKNLENQKKFMFVGPAHLEAIDIEDVQKGSVQIFPPKMIHRVLCTEPSTLSLNIVFKENDIIQSSYDVYISSQGDCNDIKLIRENSIEEESTQITMEIIKSIQDFIDSDLLQLPKEI